MDDEPKFLEELSLVLEGKGFRPVCRRSTTDAMLPSDGPIAAGILGVFFPDGPDGLRLCEDLRRRSPDASLILTSAVFDQRCWRQKAAEMGADCFFNKTWPLDSLVSDVRYAVNLRPTLPPGKPLPPDARTAVVADDDEEWRSLACLELELAGYVPYEANCGRQALLAIGRVRPDVVILDYMMPDLSGYECLEYVRKSPRMQRTPVIVVTDNEDVKVEERCLRAGANDFVLKSRSRNGAVLLLRVLKRLIPPMHPLHETLKYGPFLLDPNTRLVLADGKQLPDLSPSEFEIMSLLMEKAGQVVHWEAVERRVHGGMALSGAMATPGLKQHVLRLRGKLGKKHEDCLVAWRKVGLQLDATKAKK